MTTTNSNFTSKGVAYVPAVMGTSNGALVVGGNDRHLVHIMEFNNPKTSISYEYTFVSSNVCGVEVIPKDVSGFSNDYLVTCTSSQIITSWVADFRARTFTSNANTSIGSGNFPTSPLSMIYFPPGKPVYNTDANSNSNKLVITDATGNAIVIYTISQAASNALTINYVEQYAVYGPGNTLGEYPYPLSVNAYNSLV
jgi:hypothetical protein